MNLSQHLSHYIFSAPKVQNDREIHSGPGAVSGAVMKEKGMINWPGEK